MALTLAKFTISEAGEDYKLHIEDEDGGSFEIVATYDQLDLIVESIDQHLDEDADELAD